MAPDEEKTAVVWAPSACTLPTAERPLRMAEFDRLFAEAVTGVERVDSSLARLNLRASAETVAWVAGLAARETGCCSFFTFTLTATGGALSLDISVPDQHIEVLDELTARALAGAAG